MKTLESIKSELADYLKQAEKSDLSKREKRSIEKRIKHLYACQLYLESNPTEEFIQKQKTDVSAKIKFIGSNFSMWASRNPQDANCKNPKSKYHSVMGLRNLKAQMATLNLLLQS